MRLANSLTGLQGPLPSGPSFPVPLPLSSPLHLHVYTDLPISPTPGNVLSGPMAEPSLVSLLHLSGLSYSLPIGVLLIILTPPLVFASPVPTVLKAFPLRGMYTMLPRPHSEY